MGTEAYEVTAATPEVYIGMVPLRQIIRVFVALGAAALVVIFGLLLRYLLYRMFKGHPGPGEHKKLAQRTAELVVHCILRPSFLVLAAFAFVDEEFRRHPFIGWNPYINLLSGVFLGHLIGQLIVTSSQFPLFVRHCSGQPIHLVVLIICYTILILTALDAALSVVGLIIYFPGLHGNIHSVLKRRANKTGCRINLRARIASMVIFGFVLPVILLVLLNVFGEPAMVLGGLFFSFFCITIAYYTVVNILELRLIVSAIKEQEEGDLGTVEAEDGQDV